MCKKQGCVSHSSTEADVVALEIAVRIEVLTGLQLWDSVIDVYDGKRVKELWTLDPLRHQGGKLNPATNKSKEGRSAYINAKQASEAYNVTPRMKQEEHVAG